MTYLGKGFMTKGNSLYYGYTIGGKAKQLDNISSHLSPYYMVIPTEIEDDEITEVVSNLYDHIISIKDWKRLAVRSSAVAEDGEDKSYAGMFESKLNVPLSGLEHAVREVRASGNSDRVQAYGSSSDVAVIIMPMVKAMWSGVCFSTEPVDGTNQMLIEYELGVGGVVDGTGDSHMVLLHKEKYPADYKYRGLPKVGVKSSRRNKLNNALEVVWCEAKRLENNYRRPVDIEWAVDHEGEVYVLQVRPITVLKETINAQ